MTFGEPWHLSALATHTPGPAEALCARSTISCCRAKAATWHLWTQRRLVHNMVHSMLDHVRIGSIYSKWTFSLTKVRCKGMTLHLATIDIDGYPLMGCSQCILLCTCVCVLYGHLSHYLCTVIAIKYLAATLHLMHPRTHTC